MEQVELFTAPLLLAIDRQTRSSDLWSGRELLRIKAFPFPLTIDHGIAQRSAVRSAEFVSIVSLTVVVGMTPGAGIQRRLHRLDAFFAMFRMTAQTADPGGGVRRGHGPDKRIGSV